MRAVGRVDHSIWSPRLNDRLVTEEWQREVPWEVDRWWKCRKRRIQYSVKDVSNKGVCVVHEVEEGKMDGWMDLCVQEDAGGKVAHWHGREAWTR